MTRVAPWRTRPVDVQALPVLTRLGRTPCGTEGEPPAGPPPTRRRPVEKLEERLLFETRLADLSARFTNLPADQVDGAVEAALRLVLESFGLDRATLCQLAEDEKTLAVTHCRAAPGAEGVQRLVTQDEAPGTLQRV